jgi:hypothetical protein
MFRITRADNAGGRLLRLEGWLTAAEIPLLEESLAEARGCAITLDLSGVRWLDAPAAARLHALRAGGASLRACSPFLERLLGPNSH